MNYIWYKLYRASLKSTLSKPRGLLASIVLSVILFSNIIVFNAFISKIDLFPFVFHQIKKLIPIIQIVLFAVIYLYYSGKRFLMIIKKYRVETKKHRIIGSICVIMYAFLSFLSIIIVSLYKPGYLP